MRNFFAESLVTAKRNLTYEQACVHGCVVQLQRAIGLYIGYEADLASASAPAAGAVPGNVAKCREAAGNLPGRCREPCRDAAGNLPGTRWEPAGKFFKIFREFWPCREAAGTPAGKAVGNVVGKRSENHKKMCVLFALPGTLPGSLSGFCRGLAVDCLIPLHFLLPGSLPGALSGSCREAVGTLPGHF